MNYEDILECLETIQKCLNNNSNSCNEVKEKCIEKLELKLEFNIKNEKKKTTIIYKTLDKIIKKYNINNITLERNRNIEYLKDRTNFFIKYFNYLKKIELNKKENNKGQLEQIKKEIEKENFDNKIKDYLIEQIDNYDPPGPGMGS